MSQMLYIVCKSFTVFVKRHDRNRSWNNVKSPCLIVFKHNEWGWYDICIQRIYILYRHSSCKSLDYFLQLQLPQLIKRFVIQQQIPITDSVNLNKCLRYSWKISRETRTSLFAFLFFVFWCVCAVSCEIFVSVSWLIRILNVNRLNHRL